MANKFTVDITANDKASPAFERFGKNAGKSVKPIADLGKQSASIFESKAVESFAAGLHNVAAGAERATAGLGAAIPLSGLLGGGMVASAAAVAGFANRWSDLSTNVLRTSRRIGVGADELQLWTAAAKGAGFSGDAMAATMERLGQTLHDAKWSGNTDAAFMLEKLGIGIPMRDGVVDTTAALERMAQVLRDIKDPHTQQRLTALGVDPDTLAFLATGWDKVAAGIDKARRAGSAQSSEALNQAEAQQRALGELSNAWTRLWTKWGAAAAPAVTSVFDELSGSAKRRTVIYSSHTTGVPGGMTNTLSKDQGPVGKLVSQVFGPSLFKAPAWASPEQAQRDAAGFAMVQQELANEKDPGRRALLQAELARRSASGGDAIAGAERKGGAQVAMPDQMNVTLTINGAPQGMTASANAGGRPVPVRVAHVMPGVGP